MLNLFCCDATFSFIVAGMVTAILVFKKINLPLSLCLPFIDPLKSEILFSVVTPCVVIFQFVFSFVIAVLHVKLVQNVKASQSSLQQATNKQKTSNIYMTTQLFLITASNFLCWYPVNIIYVVAMVMEQYPVSLVFWATICFTPLNSIVNPAILVMTCLKGLFRDHKGKSQVQ